MTGFLKKYWPVILIVTFAVLLRFYKLEQLFYFTYDEEIPAFIGRGLILWHHLSLIGGVTPFGVHVPPFFYWFLALLLYFGRLNPAIWGAAGAVIAGLTTLLIYKVGTDLENKRLGITAAIFWAFSFLANVYDRHMWALYWGPLLSLAVVYFLFKLIKGKENYVFLLAVALAWGISADPSNLVFVVLTIIAYYLYKISVSKKTLLAIAIFLLSFTPLLIFDIRHNFANTKPFLKFWQTGKNNPGFQSSKFIENSMIFPRALTRLVYTFGDNQISKQYSYCSQYVSEKFNATPSIFVLLSLFLLIGFVAWSFKSKNRKSWQIFGLLIVLYFVGIQIYGTIFKADIFEHYITGLFTTFLLIVALLVSRLPKKIWLAVLGIFVAANLYKLSLALNSHGLTAKRQAIEYTMREVGDKPFSLDSLSTCWKLDGYRYLFSVFGKEPVKSYVDPNLGYLYGTTPVAAEHPAAVVVFVVHDFAPETNAFYKKYAIYKSHETGSMIFGNIEVVIMDNSSGWFGK